MSVTTKKKIRLSKILARQQDNAVDAVDYVALAQFRYHLRVFLAFSDKNVKRVGLTSQQYQVLLTIVGFSSERKMSVGELAKFMLIEHHSAVEMIERMVKSRLLKKSIDAADKRRVTVMPTQRGLTHLHRVAAENITHLRSSSPAVLKVLKSIRSRKQTSKKVEL